MNKKTFLPKKGKSQKKAFSLIELSIVLIIIGLLVAGVTGGASLVKNATLRSIMSEARGYQTAVNGFFERFQALPGDYNTLIGGTFSATPTAVGSAVTSVVGGNLDSQISYYASNATAATALNRLEGNIAWQQLKNGGFVDATFNPGMGDTTAGAVSSTYILTPGGTTLPYTTQPSTLPLTSGAGGIPASKLTNAGWAFDYVAAIAQNQIILTGAVTAPSITAQTASFNMLPVGVIVPADALSIDTKTDDALPRSGRVRSAGGTLTSGVSDGNGLSACNGATAYTTTSTTMACSIAFQVDPNS